MASSVGPLAPRNGVSTGPPDIVKLKAYSRIVDIYTQVMDGSHPRLKVPSSAVQSSFSAASSTSQAVGSVPFSNPSIIHHSSTAAQLPGLHLSSSVRDVTPHYGLNGSSHTRQVPPKSATPNLGVPITTNSFNSSITKSASFNPVGNHHQDFRLLRQQAEKALKEQQEQKRADTRHKPPPEEAKPDFDVADILAQVLAAESDMTRDRRRSASDSFDEDSYYSSKAPDSSSRNDASPRSSAARQAPPLHHEELRVDGNVVGHADPAQVDRSNSPYQVNPRPPFPAESMRRVVTVSNKGPALVEEDDEPEYSPPEIMHHSFSNDRPHVSDSPPGFRPLKQWSKWQAPREEYDLEDQMMVVRSQIASPSAPQPQRVSPLAVARDPLMPQHRARHSGQTQQRRGAAGSGRTSTENTNGNHPRKKRKIQPGKKQRPRRAESPDVVIKDEPVSPPPFHEVPPLGSNRQRPPMDRPIYIDVDPSEIRHAPERQLKQTPRRILSEMDDSAPYSAPRALSRAAFRDDLRQEPDLRRVISLQNMDREYELPRVAKASRAPSFSYADSGRPASRAPSTYDRLRLVEEGRMTSPAPRPATQNYDRSRMFEERRVESSVPRGQDSGQRYITQPMAPPARRILVDEYNRRVYDNMDRPTAAALPGRQDVMEYNERARTRNGIPPRAVSGFEDEARGSRYVEEMGPPQMVYRRITETPRPGQTEVRYMTEAPRAALSEVRYVTREPERTSYRGGSVQVYDYQEPAGTYLDDRQGREEAFMRAPAGRPITSDFQGSREIVERVQSVRPEGRGLGRYQEKNEGRREAERPVYELRQESELQRPVFEVRRAGEGDVPGRRERYYRVDENSRTMEEPPVEMSVDYSEWH